jgi:hypothetical protein
MVSGAAETAESTRFVEGAAGPVLLLLQAARPAIASTIKKILIK